MCRMIAGSATAAQTAEGETGLQLMASDTWNKIWG